MPGTGPDRRARSADSRRRGRALRAIAAAGAACWVGACGSGDLSDGVLHLDPRLEDGRSSAEVLSHAASVLEARFGTEAPGSTSSWRVTAGVVRPLPGGGIALVRSAEHRRQRTLAYGDPIEAAAIQELDLVLRVPLEVDVTLAWTAQAGEGPPQDGVLKTRLRPSQEAQSHPVQLRGRPGWRGTIRDLALSFDRKLAQEVELHAIRFSSTVFRWGAERLDEEDPSRATGDGGLRHKGLDARRVWPAELARPLVARCRVPAGGALTAAVTGGESLSPDVGALTVAIDARTGGADWEELAALELGADVLERDWSPMRADLGRFAGADVEIRFRAAPASGTDPSTASGGAEVLWACPEVFGTRPRDARPNVLLVTLDTTRADAVGGRGWTPFLDRWAARGTRFDNAWSSSNSTSPSHASILTGALTSEHGALDNFHRLPAEQRTLAEILREQGYHTMAAVTVTHLQPGTGFGQGFDRMRRSPIGKHDGARAVEAAIEMLDECAAEPARPFFLWLHLYDPHTPYLPPADFVERYCAQHAVVLPPKQVSPPTAPVFEDLPKVLAWTNGVTNHDHIAALYTLGVAYADSLVERLWRAIEARGQAENTLAVVTADHGEALGEHDHWYAHSSLYAEILRVPLLLVAPGEPGGRVVATPVSTLDVQPTICRALGLGEHAGRHGQDLFAIAAGRGPRERKLWFQLERLAQVGVQDERYHLIDTQRRIELVAGPRLDASGRRVPGLQVVEPGRRFLFDVTVDPTMGDDLAEQLPREVEQRLEWLAPYREVSGPASGLREISAEEAAALQALGYTGDDGGQADEGAKDE